MRVAASTAGAMSKTWGEGCSFEVVVVALYASSGRRPYFTMTQTVGALKQGRAPARDPWWLEKACDWK